MCTTQRSNEVDKTISGSLGCCTSFLASHFLLLYPCASCGMQQEYVTFIAAARSKVFLRNSKCISQRHLSENYVCITLKY